MRQLRKRKTQRTAQRTGPWQEQTHGMMYSNPIRAEFQWLAPNSLVFRLEPYFDNFVRRRVALAEFPQG
jgi:hypothetical protein